MTASASSTVRVLFRLAAGPRIGFGHLVRGRALARALDVAAPEVSLRGNAAAIDVANRFGFLVVTGRADDVLKRQQPDVLVLDDPSQHAARSWREAARRLNVPVLSVHDLGLSFCNADVTVDGSLIPPATKPKGLLSGPAYAILDPALVRERGRLRDPNSVLIALGGGPRLRVAYDIAEAIRASRTELRVRIAGGFVGKTEAARNGITCLGPQDGLSTELARCAVAVTGAGVSLYEAAALDTRVVAWPVVRSQHRTAQAFHRQRLATAVLPGAGRLARAVNAVLALRTESSPVRSSETIDGLGALRVADAVRGLIHRRAPEAV